MTYWRKGRPRVVGRVTSARSALWSPYGTVVVSDREDAVLIGPAGGVRELGSELDSLVLDGSGRYLAALERHYGRRSWTYIHVIDLADGARRTLDRSEGEVFYLCGFLDGGVVFAENPARTTRWVPGGQPEDVAYEVRTVDAASGTLLTWGRAGYEVVAAGSTYVVGTASTVLIAPGGSRVAAYSSPGEVDQRQLAAPSVTVHAVGVEPVRHWLPPWGIPWAWEDPDHLLVSGRRWWAGADYLRLDVRTGGWESVRGLGRVARFITPSHA